MWSCYISIVLRELVFRFDEVSMGLTLAYIAVCISLLVVLALFVRWHERNVVRDLSSRSHEVSDQMRKRHAVSRMSNGGYKGRQIELRVYNGDI